MVSLLLFLSGPFKGAGDETEIYLTCQTYTSNICICISISICRKRAGNCNVRRRCDSLAAET